MKIKWPETITLLAIVGVISAGCISTAEAGAREGLAQSTPRARVTLTPATPKPSPKPSASAMPDSHTRDYMNIANPCVNHGGIKDVTAVEHDDNGGYALIIICADPKSKDFYLTQSTNDSTGGQYNLPQDTNK